MTRRSDTSENMEHHHYHQQYVGESVMTYHPNFLTPNMMSTGSGAKHGQPTTVEGYRAQVSRNENRHVIILATN